MTSLADLDSTRSYLDGFNLYSRLPFILLYTMYLCYKEKVGSVDKYGVTVLHVNGQTGMHELQALFRKMYVDLYMILTL